MARFKVQCVRTETVRTLSIEDLTFPVTVRIWHRDDGLYEGIATGGTKTSAISQSTAKTETELLESLASGIFKTCVLLGIARQ